MDPITSVIFLFVYTLVSLACVYYFLIVGCFLVRMTSIDSALKRFLKKPKQSSWIEKYFFGWVFWKGQMTQKMLDIFGDKWVTLYYRATGLIFLIFGIVFAVGVIANWMLVLGFFD